MLIHVAIDAVERAEADEIFEILRQFELEKPAPQEMIRQCRAGAKIRALDRKELDGHSGELRLENGGGRRRLGFGDGGLVTADDRSGGRRRLGNAQEEPFGILLCRLPVRVFR